MTRAFYWLLLALFALGYALVVWIVLDVFVFDASPGAKMKLMGVACLSVPMSICALGAIGIVLLDDGSMSKRWERTASWVVGLLTLTVFGTLMLFG